MTELSKVFVAEFIGTLIFLGTIFYVVSKKEDLAWIKIALSLGVAIVLLGSVSGGKFNPAVSFMFFITKKTSVPQFIIELIAQIIGALASIGLYYGVIQQ